MEIERDIIRQFEGLLPTYGHTPSFLQKSGDYAPHFPSVVAADKSDAPIVGKPTLMPSGR